MSRIVSVELAPRNVVVIYLRSGFGFRAYFDEFAEASEVADGIRALLAENARLKEQARSVRAQVEALADAVTP